MKNGPSAEVPGPALADAARVPYPFKTQWRINAAQTLDEAFRYIRFAGYHLRHDAGIVAHLFRYGTVGVEQLVVFKPFHRLSYPFSYAVHKLVFIFSNKFD